MKKTLLTLLTVLGAGSMAFAADYNVASPYVDASVTRAGGEAIFDLLVASESVLNALEQNGQTVNNWGINGENIVLNVWPDGTSFNAGDSSYPGIGYSDFQFDGYVSLNVGSIGWSGAGIYISAPGVGNSYWNDNTRFHMAYRTTSTLPSAGITVAGARFSIGTPFVDGGYTFQTAGNAASEEWQAVDMSLAELKQLDPSFTYTPGTIDDNILTFLCGGVTGQNICLDAVYFYTPVEKVNYMEEPAIDPANNSILASLGNITFTWDDVNFDIPTEVGEAYNLDMDLVTVYLDGTVNTTWKDSMGASFSAQNIQGSNEQMGGGLFSISTISLNLGDNAFSWKGNVKIVIAEGAVKTTDGDISPAFELNYKLVETTTSEPTWTPGEKSTLTQGDAVITVAWTEGNVTEIYTSDPDACAFVTNAAGERKSLANKLSIVDGKLSINASSLAAGNYELCLPEGSVVIADEYVNAETYYHFTMEAGDFVAPTLDPKPGLHNAFNGPVKIMWPGYAVSLNPGSTEKITAYYNGVECDEFEFYWMFADADGFPIWPDDDDEDAEPVIAEGICVFLPFGWSEDGSPWTYQIEVPTGMFIISKDGDSSFNGPLDLVYKGININDELTCTPARGSKLKSLSEFSFTWDEYVAKLNPACTEEITYNYGANTATIVANADGSFTVTPEAPITSHGYVSFNFPEGMFILSTDYGDVESGYFDIMYQISIYTVDPANYTELDEPLSSITIYSDNITLAGDVKDIEVRDTYNYDYELGDYPVIGYGASYEAVTSAENGDGIKITFALDEVEVRSYGVTIPAGMFNFDGTLSDQIDVEYYYTVPMPDPTITPADGSNIEELVSVEITWNDSPLEANWFYELYGEPFTLTINGGEPIDITDKVKIENEVNTELEWEIITASKIVILFDEPYTAEGTYEIYVPADYVNVENYGYESNGEITITYIIGDPALVKFAEAENGIIRVYDLNGVNVMTTKDAEALKALSNGLYIINGKKVIIRK